MAQDRTTPALGQCKRLLPGPAPKTLNVDIPLHPLSTSKRNLLPDPDPGEIRSYVANQFKHRQCHTYVRDVDSDSYNCQCGRDVPWHEEHGIPVDKTMEPAAYTWNADRHSESLPEPTTFGFINFHGFGQEVSQSVPYIRLDHTSSHDHTWKLLCDYWCMPRPKLIISVTGGTRKFLLKDKLRSALKRGLVRSATTTSAWVVTGGTGVGVMEFVGETVKEHMLATGGSGQKIVVLGIATWGVVNNKEALIGQQNEGKFPATYYEKLPGDGGITLDHNHTHFILVDDGTEGKFGGEIEFRTDLEKDISKKSNKDKPGEDVPVVTILLEGGRKAIKTALEGVKRNTPVVIIDDSGRAADLLAEAFREKASNGPAALDALLNKKLRGTFDWDDDPREVFQQVLSCRRHIEELLDEKYAHLVSIFSLEGADGKNEIDASILNALLKANKSNVTTQLNLALALDCCDVARSDIFTKQNRILWQNVDLSEPMFTALVQDQPDFVQLLLENGADLKLFLTVRRLRDLYFDVMTDGAADASAHLLKHELESSRSTFKICHRHDADMKSTLLQTVGNLVCWMLRDRLDNIYDGIPFEVVDEVNIGMDPDIRINGIPRPDFSNPERELFIWAVLLNRNELAMLFWKAGVDHIASALTASAMLKSISTLADKQEELDLSQKLKINARGFEDLAVGVLHECYLHDRDMAHKLLVRELENWGNTTQLTIADSAELMDFMGHTACQHKLNKIWHGKMTLHTSLWKILANLFLPFFIVFIKFSMGGMTTLQVKVARGNGNQDSAPNKSLLDKRKAPVAAQNGHLVDETGDDTPDATLDGQKTKNTIPLLDAIHHYNTAPIVKFCYHTISQVIFVGLFSYFVLCNLYPISHPNSPSGIEIAVWVWSTTLNIEEIRQFLTRDAKSLRYKLSGYLESAWNVLDVATQCFFWTSVILHLTLDGEDFIWARTFYCLTLFLYYVRFMQVFNVSVNIGPKVIMIRQMLTDLMFFFCILVLFLLAFGVTSHALRYPNTELSWSTVREIVYMPYWQMYGELFLDDLEGDVGECSHNRTEWEHNPEIVRCPEVSRLAVILLALYMILTNVLLLNLLIAMFSHTFQRVQDNSERVWRYYRYGLIHEFAHKPTLAPPLIIFSHIWRLCKWICRQCDSKKNIRRWLYQPDKFKVVIPRVESVRLTSFEKSAAERHCFNQWASEDEDINVQVASAKGRIEKVILDLDEIKDKVTYRPDHGPISPSQDRLDFPDRMEPTRRQLELEKQLELLLGILQTRQPTDEKQQQ